MSIHGSGSASNAAAITPNDSATINQTRGLWVGTAGDLTVDMAEIGTNITFPNLTVGWHPLKVSKIYATGTAASDIVAVW